MAELMSDAVAAEFSFEGRKGKLAFSSYPLIYSAVLGKFSFGGPNF